MPIPPESDFWPLLARRINDRLSRLADNNLRFLWVDDIIVEPAASGGDITGYAYVSEGSRSFERYRFSLHIRPSEHVHSSESNPLAWLPDAAADGWLDVRRGQKEMTVTLPAS